MNGFVVIACILGAIRANETAIAPSWAALDPPPLGVDERTRDALAVKLQHAGYVDSLITSEDVDNAPLVVMWAQSRLEVTLDGLEYMATCEPLRVAPERSLGRRCRRPSSLPRPRSARCCSAFLKCGTYSGPRHSGGGLLLAHIHELGPAKFDAENGSPGICYYMQHPDVIIDMERRAYGLEITMATTDGYAELAKRLERNLEAEVRRIEGR